MYHPTSLEPGFAQIYFKTINNTGKLSLLTRPTASVSTVGLIRLKNNRYGHFDRFLRFFPNLLRPKFKIFKIVITIHIKV